MGKYLKLFDNHSQYETFTGSTAFVLPNVSHCVVEEHVHYNSGATPPIPPAVEFSTFHIVSSGATFQIDGDNMKYTNDNGATWTPFTSTDVISGTSGDNFSFSVHNIRGLNTEGKFDIGGHIMSLVYGDSWSGQTIPSGQTFTELFRGSGVVNAGSLFLPIEELPDNCFKGMFQDCVDLVHGPGVVVGDVASERCCEDMFRGCVNLLEAPGLPATTLAPHCYQGMFYGCVSLDTDLFELPAETLVPYCYQNMFYGCSSVNSIMCLATDISATNCTTDWMNGVSSDGTFYKPLSMSDWTSGASGIPNDWIVQIA